MKIQIEIIIVLGILLLFIGWATWHRISLWLIKRSKKYKEFNDGRKNKQQGGEQRRDSEVDITEHIPAGTSQPAERELLPSADPNVSGKNLSGFRNSLNRIRRSKR